MAMHKFSLVLPITLCSLCIQTTSRPQAAGLIFQEYSKEYKICMERSSGATAEILDCSEAEISKQDKKLNAVYKILMQKATEQSKAALRDAQRGWLSYRDTSCKLIRAFGGGGTRDVLATSSCMLDETSRRAAFLENLIEE